MIPLIVGAIAGALAMRTLQRTLPRTVPTASVGKVKARLREASICGLSNLEHSSAKLRQHLASVPEVAPAVSPDEPQTTPADSPAPQGPAA